MAAGSTYTPIATTTISSGANYTFTSIPSTYTDLVLVCNMIDTAVNVLAFQLNSDTGSNYSSTRVYGTGSAAASSRDSSFTYIDLGTTSTSYGTSIINFENYANTTTYKTVLGRVSDPGNRVTAGVGLWRSTAAINSIKVYGGSNWTGSKLTLYGIQAA